MKAIKPIIGRLTIGCVIALGLTSNLHAQDQERQTGTYYSAKDPDLPPWPYNAHPELESVEVEPGIFLIDDTMIPDTPEQEAARAARLAASQLPPDPASEAEAARQRELRWQAKLEAAQPIMRSVIPPGKTISGEKQQKGEAEFQKLREQSARSAAEQPDKERALDELAERIDAPREVHSEDGRKLILTDEIAGAPAYIGSQNTVAAAGVSADELWPAGAWPYSENNSGLNLTGTNVTLSMWEVDGGVLTNHLEFGARVTQRDNAALDVKGHATEVAGTMAAGGNGSLFGGFYEARGVAYQASVFAYDTANFKSERESVAAGDATNGPVSIGNQSWGLVNGWRQENIVYQGNPISNAWVWYGQQPTSFPEDVKFGFYTPTNNVDTGCVQIDQFHNSEATHHLMVYACGNDRLEGPGASPGTYYRLVGTSYVADTTTRDWQDGDEGGYDSLAAPGTAKNVLTVGACEDVYWVSNSFVVFGFGPGANAVPASFSGAGPTDDGRLKPDLTAVGAPNLALRNVLGQISGTNILGLISPTSTATNLYAGFARGTSFAAPGVSGALGLVLQRRTQLYPGLSASEAWLNSTLKALVIDTCDDVGAEGPDYRFGHGILNAQHAVERVGEDYDWGRGSLIKEFTLSPTQSVSWVVTSDGTEPLSVTAAWSDLPGPALTSVTSADPVNPMLVNNIDIEVEQLSNSTLYRPWVLNPDLTNKTSAARSAAATRGVDNRNNVERVSIATPTAGDYRITVTHSGGLAGNPSPTNQAVSVVLGGMTPPEPVMTALDKSPTANEFLLSFAADPGAYFTLETSTNLFDWSDAGSVLAESDTNAVTLNSSDAVRFWRLRRGQ